MRRGRSRGEASNEGVWFFWSRTSLRKKEGRNKERVSRKLDNPDLALTSHTAGHHPALLKVSAIGGIDAVVAIVSFGHVPHPIERDRLGVGDDRYWFLRSDERARERRDEQTGPAGVGLCVVGVLEPEDVARELDDRVLEPPSGPDQGDTALARVADRT